MMLTFKLLGLLLSYPSEDLQHNMDELKTAIEGEGLIPAKIRKPLFAFMDSYANRNLMRLQEDYVALFDRGRAHSLYLFEHIHGESRDRGQAMVNLSDHYIQHGVTLSAKELPDYLPVFLEFLSEIDIAEAQTLLGEVVHIIAGVGAKLRAKKVDYHQVFRALEVLTSVKVGEKLRAQAVREAAEEDTSHSALDKEWEDAPAFDGVGQIACHTCPSTIQKPKHSATNEAAPSPMHINPNL